MLIRLLAGLDGRDLLRGVRLQFGLASAGARLDVGDLLCRLGAHGAGGTLGVSVELGRALGCMAGRQALPHLGRLHEPLQQRSEIAGGREVLDERGPLGLGRGTSEHAADRRGDQGLGLAAQVALGELGRAEHVPDHLGQPAARGESRAIVLRAVRVERAAQQPLVDLARERGRGHPGREPEQCAGCRHDALRPGQTWLLNGVGRRLKFSSRRAWPSSPGRSAVTRARNWSHCGRITSGW